MGGKGGIVTQGSSVCVKIIIKNIANCANRTSQAVDQITEIYIFNRVVDWSSHQISLSSLHLQNINLIINISVFTLF